MTFAWARRSMHRLFAPLPVVFAVLLGTVLVASPWIILFHDGWPPSLRLFVRLYLLPYPLVMLAFALIMACVCRRELTVRVRKWRAARSQRN
jgi:hypothetical protein